MSRGRGQGGSGGAGRVRPAALQTHHTGEGRLRLFCSRLEQRAKQETGGGSDYGDLTGYWREDGRQFLARLSVSTLTEALELGDWQSAREITAEYDRRRGEARRAKEAHDAPDLQARNAVIWARMHRWLMKDPETVTNLVPVEVRAREISYDQDFLALWPSSAEEQVKTLRAEGRREEALRDDWRVPGSKTRALELTHGDLAVAGRAVRAAIAKQAAGEPVEVVVKLTQEAFTRFVADVRDEKGFRRITGGVIGRRETPYAIATLERRIDGRPVVLRLTTDVTDRLPKGGGDRAALRAAMAFAQAPSLIADFDQTNLEGAVLSETGAAPTKRTFGPMEDLTTAEAFGPACRHPRARWKRTGCQVRLVCDDCFDGCITCVPAHRLPESHALHQKLGEDQLYAHELRYWDAVHGKLDGHSEREITPVSIKPADYLDLPPRTPRATRITSVADAMRRR